jgi:hypothetical protein
MTYRSPFKVMTDLLSSASRMQPLFDILVDEKSAYSGAAEAVRLELTEMGITDASALENIEWDDVDVFNIVWTRMVKAVRPKVYKTWAACSGLDERSVLDWFKEQATIREQAKKGPAAKLDWGPGRSGT